MDEQDDKQMDNFPKCQCCSGQVGRIFLNATLSEHNQGKG